MSPIERTRCVQKGLAFLASSITLSIWTIPLLMETSFSASFPFILILRVSLMLFLFYRTLTSFQLLNHYTAPLDRFFYENRKGSLSMIFLALIWGLYVLQLLALAVLDLILPGGQWWDAKWLGPLGEFLQAIMVLASLIVFIGLIGWLGTTAVEALWRISSPREVTDHAFQGVPLTENDLENLEDDDVWDGWKSNDGNSGGSSSV